MEDEREINNRKDIEGGIGNKYNRNINTNPSNSINDQSVDLESRLIDLFGYENINKVNFE